MQKNDYALPNIHKSSVLRLVLFWCIMASPFFCAAWLFSQQLSPHNSGIHTATHHGKWVADSPLPVFISSTKMHPQSNWWLLYVPPADASTPDVPLATHFLLSQIPKVLAQSRDPHHLPVHSAIWTPTAQRVQSGYYVADPKGKMVFYYPVSLPHQDPADAIALGKSLVADLRKLTRVRLVNAP